MTYTPSKFPPAAALKASGASSAGSISTGAFSPTLTASTNTVGVTGSGTSTLTITKRGHYAAMFKANIRSVSVVGGTVSVELRKNGVSQNTSPGFVRAAEGNVERSGTIGAFFDGELLVNDTISVSITGDWTEVDAGTFAIVFVPTGAYPQ